MRSPTARGVLTVLLLTRDGWVSAHRSYEPVTLPCLERGVNLACDAPGGDQDGRRIPSFLIRLRSVSGFNPKSSAAPPFP